MAKDAQHELQRVTEKPCPGLSLGGGVMAGRGDAAHTAP